LSKDFPHHISNQKDLCITAILNHLAHNTGVDSIVIDCTDLGIKF
jgi:hypothetical protein